MKIKISTIIRNEKLSKDTYLLEFKHNGKVYPTQFILIDTYPYRFLLKPFSIADFENGNIKIIYRAISDGTKWLSNLKISQPIKYLGPFGNFQKIKNLKIDKNTKIFLIAGGSGIASLVFIYKYLIKYTQQIYTFYGEKDKNYLINLKKLNFKNIIYATDNGSFGEKGNIIDVVKKNLRLTNLKPDFIFVCGPKEMIKNSKIFLEITTAKCFALLEEYMCCGVGVCRSCVVKVKDKDDFVYQAICKDGPLFELKLILL
ncbi:MAG: hypothetical protein RMJ67_05205 [Elusimicrobiota bacterium]|nr:hypothetical protein [Endomicrobiia bacterium]MCX7910420.1 hypothetical protein [Endomicrobiia bacterium]MDW8165887.1 hypothetical protein [Elusimicrobiota bacterium]